MTTLIAIAILGMGMSGAPIEINPVPEQVKPKLVTITYDLRPILGEKSATTKLADPDAVIRLILDSVKVGELKPGSSGTQLIARDGNKLEVHATAKVHGEIKELLEALERLADLAIDIKTEVIELDPADFEKLVKSLPKPEKGKPGSPILFGSKDGNEMDLLGGGEMVAEANKLLKAGKVVQKSEARFANGIEASVSSRQSVRTYFPTRGEEKQGVLPQFVKEGFKLVALPVVSADRRFVRFKLTEQSTEVVGMLKREINGFGEAGLLRADIIGPDVSDQGATGSAIVPDGGSLLFRLAYAPKDKIWLVVIRPTIFIQAEEDEWKKEGKK